MPERREYVSKTALVFCLGFGISAQAGDANLRLTQPEVEAHARTCSHFTARARNQPRVADAQLEVVLADSCERAFSSLYQSVETTRFEAQYARSYLDKLTEFKAAIVSINMDRMFGAEHTSRVPTQNEVAATSPETSGVRPISATGEYLIARQMGLLGAYREWAGVAKFTLAEDS